MKKTVKYILWLAVLLVGISWIIWENQRLVTTHYEVADSGLPESFDGFCIVQISDLHNTEFGRDNQRLLSKIRQAQPDIIAITGDLIDSRVTKVEIAMDFVREAVKIAPCYYVMGNHEARDEQYENLQQQLVDEGVRVLHDEVVSITRAGESLCIMGIDEYTVFSSKEIRDSAAAQALDRLETARYSILLSHRAESYQVFCRYGVDLALAGHNHGGQFRIPWLGGVYASGELFPQYDGGLFREGSTAMVVSRGLGNSLFPFRLNNPPEIVVVTLHKQ